MRKLSLFLFITTFLICTSLSRVTSVSADVTFGGDDELVVSASQLEAYRKLALLGSVGDLVSSGVTSIDITGTNSVDDFLDSLMENITLGLTDDNPVSNFGLGVWETLDEFNTYLTDTSYDLIYKFGNINSATSAIADLIRDISGTKVEYKKNPNVRTHFNAISKVSSGPSAPAPPVDYSFLNNTIDWLWANGSNYTFASGKAFDSSENRFFPAGTVPGFNWSFVAWEENGTNNSPFYNVKVSPVNFIKLYITDDLNGNITLSKTGGTELPFRTSANNQNYRFQYITQRNNSNYLDCVSPWQSIYDPYAVRIQYRTSFDSLSVCANYIYRNFRHVDIYYNNSPWVLVSEPTPVSIDLDINGLLKLFGSDDPVTYYYPSGIQIDYEALYNVILRAIQNGTPVSQTTINEGNVYYDSHDTVYSPTIYNYYSSGEDEQDFIDDILDLATIPKFDTALVEPLAEPMTNGAAIFGAGISVVPRDILFVVGAGFVLVLFVALINRLIE